MQKPSIPKGTRDFSPVQTNRRNYIFNTIEKVFKKYRYNQIETPAMENLSTLMGKYGEEGDKLLFKILNSGDFLKKVNDDNLYNEPNKLTTKICEKGLRYDLTVPFARYIVQHYNDISFPFKRYQIQPVWRADRPQKGRYREFYQCDVDIIGSNSLLNEIELIQIIDEVFNNLQINTTIKLNNRKILSGIAETIGEPERFMDITIAIDKLDKIGETGVKKELNEKGLSEDAISRLDPILKLGGSNRDKLNQIKEVISGSETGLKGIDEMTEIFDLCDSLNINTTIELDLTLARGLNYYTGSIFEVKANDVQIGSICGGGRYDDLTGIFGLKDMSGVGISFGADRIYDVLDQLDGFQNEKVDQLDVLFINFGKKESAECLVLCQELRNSGVVSEVFPDSAKMKKQMNYANNTGVSFVVLIGENEINTRTASVKNMSTGEQKEVKFEELKNFFV
jgi:histidyl-tRNA synthetase